MSSLLGIGGGGNVGAAGGTFYDYEISQSLRLDDTSGAKLTISSASPTATNRKKVAISCWVKRSFVGSGTYTIFHGGGSGLMMQFGPTGADEIYLYQSPWQIYKDALLIRDIAGWYHFALILDSTQATDSNRAKLYINGELEDFSTWQVGAGAGRYPGLNVDFNWHTGTAMRIGSTGGSDDLAGYIADFISIDGQDVSISDFGEDKNGVWVPKDVSGLTLGNAGFYLDFADSSNIGNDAGANNIDFTPANLDVGDVVSDSPTNNFATMNLLDNLNWVSQGLTRESYAQGNLQASGTSWMTRCTFPLDSGKWYWEVRKTNFVSIGIYETDGASNNSNHAYYYNNGSINDATSSRTSPTVLYSGTNHADGTIIGVEFDVDNLTLEFYANGVSLYKITGLDDAKYTASFGTSANTTFQVNFGQDPTFCGQFTGADVGTQTDENGYGLFKYEPSAGFLAICTANLPEPDIGPNSDTNSDEHFNTVLWSGNSTNNRSITTDHATDLVWIKKRGTTVQSHVLADSVRGTSDNGGTGNVGILSSNLDNAESTNSSDSGIASFDSTGFTIGAGSNTANADAPYQGTNASGHTYVGWSWKAGGTASTIAVDAYSAGVPSIASSVSANQDSGFSIVSWSGTGAAGTIGHGLSSAPEHIIVKNRDTAGRIWLNYVKAAVSDAETDYLSLSGPGALVDNGDVWNDTAPTPTVFSVGSNASANQGGDDMIAYCFHSVPGFSRVASYVGNGDPDGMFVYTGFRPALVMAKQTNSSRDWIIKDNQRPTYNSANLSLYPNLSNAEGSGEDIDLLSNGFKIRTTNGKFNISGGSYIYLAFAESPFKYANAR